MMPSAQADIVRGELEIARPPQQTYPSYATNTRAKLRKVYPPRWALNPWRLLWSRGIVDISCVFITVSTFLLILHVVYIMFCVVVDISVRL